MRRKKDERLELVRKDLWGMVMVIVIVMRRERFEMR